MTRIAVTASHSYEVLIGTGVLSELGTRIQTLTSAATVAIVSDSTVAPLYLSRVTAELEAAGLRVVSFVFPAGEASKSGTTYLELLSFLAGVPLTRTDVLLALGGGVVGDLTGFAAATYLRGIPFLQVPTTLLAAVDSSVGGKTAIDLPCGKNLVGAFYQPRLVLCDTEFLQTLPPAILEEGCAEVVKYGMLGSPRLLEDLLAQPAHAWSEAGIAQCVSLKRDLVAADEFDQGARQLLNLGHTVGHAVEACSCYACSHGAAVAIGLSIITRAAVRKGFCPSLCLTQLDTLLQAYHLPNQTDFSPAALFSKVGADKKRRGDRLTCVLPCAVGQSVLRDLPLSDFLDWIETGWAV